MDLTPILHAAIRATGGNPDATTYDANDLERAQQALRMVDARIDKALGYTEVTSITLTGEHPSEPTPG